MHREDPKIMNLLIEIARFWENSKTWPLLQSWGECADFGRLPPNLVML
jgi:hypothetical protein